MLPQVLVVVAEIIYWRRRRKMLSLFFRFSYLPDSGQLGVPRGAFPLDSLLGFWSQP